MFRYVPKEGDPEYDYIKNNTETNTSTGFYICKICKKEFDPNKNEVVDRFDYIDGYTIFLRHLQEHWRKEKK